MLSKTLKTFLSDVKTLYAIVPIVATVITYLVTSVEKQLTVPVAGYVFRHIEKPNGEGTKGRTIAVYELFNPGPSDLDDVFLSFTVDEALNEKLTYDSGMIVRALDPASTVRFIREQGDQSRFEVRPASARDNTCCIHPSESVAVKIVAPRADWEPSEAAIIGFYSDEKEQRNASHVRPAPRSSALLRWALFGVPTLIAMIVGVFLQWLRQSAIVESAVRRAKDAEWIKTNKEQEQLEPTAVAEAIEHDLAAAQRKSAAE